MQRPLLDRARGENPTTSGGRRAGWTRERAVERLICVGVPAQIVDLVAGGDHEAIVDVSGVRRRVDVSLILADGLAVGDWVLLHVGFAMGKIDEDEARRTLELMVLLGGGDEFTALLESAEQESAAQEWADTLDAASPSGP